MTSIQKTAANIRAAHPGWRPWHAGAGSPHGSGWYAVPAPDDMPLVEVVQHNPEGRIGPYRSGGELGQAIGEVTTTQGKDKL